MASGSRGGKLALWIILIVVAAIGVILAFSFYHASEKKKAAAIPAPWAFTETADGVDLSQTPAESSGKDFAPKLHIVCRHGRPNVELDPVFITYTCGADCAGGGKVGFDETFLSVDDPSARYANAKAKGASAPLGQDLLSNAPGDIIVTGDPGPGVSQGGEWAKSSGSTAATRFDYGSSEADAKYVASVDLQARNFINRMARSRAFSVGQGGAGARYDTRALSSALPKLWAVCPAPNAK